MWEGMWFFFNLCLALGMALITAGVLRKSRSEIVYGVVSLAYGIPLMIGLLDNGYQMGIILGCCAIVVVPICFFSMSVLNLFSRLYITVASVQILAFGLYFFLFVNLP